MAQFLVKWEIDIEADDFETAAKEALEIQRDKTSEAVAFTVVRQSDKKELDVDLINDVYSFFDKIKYIKKVINEWGGFTTAEVEADCSPVINVLGDASILVEEFYHETVVAFNYIHGTCINEEVIKYEDLESDVIDDIVALVEDWEVENEKTQKRISD